MAKKLAAPRTNQSGEFVVSSRDEALAALKYADDLQAAVEAIERENHLDETRREIKALNEAVHKFVIAKGIKELPADGYKLKLIRPKRSAWNADILRNILTKAQWLLITRAVPDPMLIDQAVKAGKLDADKIAEAFVSTASTPYVRRYDDKPDAEDEAENVRVVLDG